MANSRSDLLPPGSVGICRHRSPRVPRPLYDGRTLGCFEGQAGLEVGRTPDDSIAFARVCRLGADGTCLTFEAHEFVATPATAADPLVLGRLTIALGNAASCLEFVDLQVSALLEPLVTTPLALTCLHLPVYPAAWLQREWPPLTQQPWHGPPQRVELSLRRDPEAGDPRWRLATARFVIPTGDELPEVHAVLGLRVQSSAAGVEAGSLPTWRERSVERLRRGPGFSVPVPGGPGV